MLAGRKVLNGTEYAKIVDEISLEAFPDSERLTVEEMHQRGGDPEVTLYFDGEEPVGFTYVLSRPGMRFLYFLAVSAGNRGKGRGGEILEGLKASNPGCVVFLNVESPEEECGNREQRRRRIGFYERHGLRLADYRLFAGGTVFESLSTRPMSMQEYEGFFRSVGLEPTVRPAADGIQAFFS